MESISPSTEASSPVIPTRTIKWIASDMDETFLSPTHSVHKDTRRVYRKLTTNNIPIIPATGRSLRALRRVLKANAPDFLPEMRFFPGVYLNGTCVFGESEDDVIYAHKMDIDSLKNILEGYYKLKDEGKVQECTVFLQHIRGSYTDINTQYFLDHVARWHEEHPEEIHDSIIKVLDREDKFWCQVSFIGHPEQIDHLQNVLFRDPLTLAIMKEKNLHMLRPIPPMISILPGTESKAKGLKQLVERYPHYQIDSMLTIGDGNNDIEMLKLTKWSVAMGQAADSVKSAAQMVAPTNSEQGWAQFLDSLNLVAPRPSDKASSVSWVCTDMDGTFLSSDHRVTPLTEKTYVEARSKGIEIVFATGRTLTAAEAVLSRNKDFRKKHVSFHPGIYCNGAYVVGKHPGDAPIVLKTLPAEAARTFAQFAYRHFESHPDQRALLMTHHTTGAYIDYDLEMWKPYRARYEEEDAKVLNAPITSLLDGPEAQTMLQLHCCGDDKLVPCFMKALTSDTATLDALAALGTYVVTGIPACATLVRLDVSKAEGIQKLSDHYAPKYAVGEALILGDGGNDKEMLQMQEAAMTVAMGQAPAWVQLAARAVGPSNANEGWSQIVKGWIPK